MGGRANKAVGSEEMGPRETTAVQKKQRQSRQRYTPGLAQKGATEMGGSFRSVEDVHVAGKCSNTVGARGRAWQRCWRPLANLQHCTCRKHGVTVLRYNSFKSARRRAARSALREKILQTGRKTSDAVGQTAKSVWTNC